MTEEFELLSKSIESLGDSIESLKQTPSLFSVYVFPIASAFLSAIFGGAIGYFAVTRQEGTKFEKEKMDSANRCIMTAEQAFMSLLAVKKNYHSKLTSDPIQRITAIPRLIGTTNKLDFDVLPLSFITHTKGKRSEKESKWTQVTYIKVLMHNFNEVVSIWEKSETLTHSIKEKLIEESSSGASAQLSHDEIFKIVSEKDLAVAAGPTEYAIKLTDELLIEFDDFLKNFPQIAKSRIKTKRLKNYGKVMELSGRAIDIAPLLKKTPEVDFELLSILFDEPISITKQRFITGYESKL